MGEKIKVFTPDEKSLKTLGELLSNDTSRKIIKILIEDEMYVNQISVKLSITPNLVTHHLKKLESIGLVNVTSKPISRKTKNHNFYKIRNDIFVDLKPKEDKLKRIFRPGIKIAGVCTGIIGTFSSLQFIQKVTSKKPIYNQDAENILGDTPVQLEPLIRIDIFWSDLYSIIASLSAGAIIILYFLKIKKK